MPSRLTLGVRLTPCSTASAPWLRSMWARADLEVHRGSDAELRGISISDSASPWTPSQSRSSGGSVEAAPVAMPEPKRFISGVVVDARTGEPLPNAIGRFKDKDLTAMVTNQQGLFRHRDLLQAVHVRGLSRWFPRGRVPDGSAGGCRRGRRGPAGARASPSASANRPPAACVTAGEPWTAPPGAAPGAAPGGDIQAGVKCELKALPAVGTVTGW